MDQKMRDKLVNWRPWELQSQVITLRRAGSEIEYLAIYDENCVIAFH